MKFIVANLLLLMPAFVTAQPAERYEVIIDEIMADPTPMQGLPNSEFAELRNVSKHAFNLKGWAFCTAHSRALINTDFFLEPDSIVILCPSSAQAPFSPFGRTLGFAGFPSLNNDGDLVWLQSAEGKTIHALNYQLNWYHNNLKQLGGWSLEMIDAHFPCAGVDNWSASVHESGGTPGKPNSIAASQEDLIPAEILRSYMSDSVTAVLLFSKSLDSSDAVNISHYKIQQGAIEDVEVEAPLFNEVHVTLQQAMHAEEWVEIEISNLKDCSGNSASFLKSKLALFAAPDSLDIIINEILFDPPPNAADFIEIYNRSTKAIDLSQVYVGNRNPRGEISSLKRISESGLPFLPGEFVVLTEDSLGVLRNYLVKEPRNLVQVKELPSWPNDKGVAVILDRRGMILDELVYDAKWHFPLLADPEGVSLERIDYNLPTQDPFNWHSAATLSGYGTPGYENSSLRNAGSGGGMIQVSPDIFSPDNDGHDDFARLEYSFAEPGHVCNLTIFDINGREVRRLVKNAICGTTGAFSWDGLDESQRPLPMGVYILYSQFFDLKGKVQTFKQIITLARRS